jgi:hypothetical protein
VASSTGAAAVLFLEVQNMCEVAILTGATGLLGQYLLGDLLHAGAADNQPDGFGGLKCLILVYAQVPPGAWAYLLTL